MSRQSARGLGSLGGHGGMSDAWKSHLGELRRRRQRAEGLGGEARIAAERKRGRLSARERIEALVDPGSFQEVGKLAALRTRSRDGTPKDTLPSSLVCGFGRVDGRPVAVGAEDYTVAMAPWTGLYLEKSKGVFPGYLEDMAYEWEIPIVLFLQSVGGDVDSASVDAMNTIPVGAERPPGVRAARACAVGHRGDGTDRGRFRGPRGVRAFLAHEPAERLSVRRRSAPGRTCARREDRQVRAGRARGTHPGVRNDR